MDCLMARIRNIVSITEPYKCRLAFHPEGYMRIAGGEVTRVLPWLNCEDKSRSFLHYYMKEMRRRHGRLRMMIVYKRNRNIPFDRLYSVIIFDKSDKYTSRKRKKENIDVKP